MAGKVKEARRRKDLTLVLPGETQWEIWKFPPHGEPQLVGSCSEPSASEVPKHGTLALPVQNVFSLPLWIIQSEQSLVSEVVFLQIDRRGLAARNREETVWDFQIISQDESQSLLMVAVLPPNLPENYFSSRIDDYFLSAQFYPFPENQFIFWRECGRLSLAVTHQKQLIHFQSLSSGTFTSTVIQEIRCLHLILETQNITYSVVGCTVWGNFQPDELQPLNQIFGNHVFHQQRPPPRLSGDLLKLTPHRVQVAHTEKHQAQKTNRLLKLVATLYFLSILGITAHVGWLKYQVWSIQKEVNAKSQDVQSVMETQNRWESMETAINPTTYPLENLLVCTRPVPEQGLRLTLFRQEDSRRFTVQGEASDDPIANQYEQQLRDENNELQWEPLVKTPPNEGNPFVSLSISGIRPHAPAH